MTELGDLLLQAPGFFISLLILWNTQDGSVLRQVSVARGIEEGQRFVVFNVSNWIVRVGMALHAVDRQSIQNRPCGRRTVHGCDQPELFVVCPAFIVVGSLAV